MRRRKSTGQPAARRGEIRLLLEGGAGPGREASTRASASKAARRARSRPRPWAATHPARARAAPSEERIAVERAGDASACDGCDHDRASMALHPVGAGRGLPRHRRQGTSAVDSVGWFPRPGWDARESPERSEEGSSMLAPRPRHRGRRPARSSGWCSTACGSEAGSPHGARARGQSPWRAPLSKERMAARELRGASEALRRTAWASANPKQILFGDLHVHSTFSFDAFTMSPPHGGGRWRASRWRTPATSRATARSSISGPSTTTR